ncbi:MAG: hypothetical protein EPO61_07060 [Nitrospirae bacterium]|nr:MAG: hypothetical protein EPO61_07060 [Nitrospirota bacterium]
MRLLVSIMAVLVTLMQAPSLRADETVPDPAAYSLDTTTEIRILPNSLLLIIYADRQTGRSTYATLHRVYAVMPAPADSDFSALGVSVTLYTTGGAEGLVTYAVGTYPLFYGDRLADDGFPDRLWEDPLEDGLNGNEVSLADGFRPADHLQVADLDL